MSLGCSQGAVASVQVEAQQYFSTCDCPDYLQIAERRLEEEKERVINYLDPSTEPKMTRVLEKELISKQVRLLFCRALTDCSPSAFMGVTATNQTTFTALQLSISVHSDICYSVATSGTFSPFLAMLIP